MNSEQLEDDLEAIGAKRLATLRGIWRTLVANNLFYENRLVLSEAALGEIVEFYLSDLRIIKRRYNIRGRIKRHKIAGLMTSAILRFRPIHVVGGHYENDAELYANEFFAIIHALAICGERNDQTLRIEILSEDWFGAWLDSFMYLLHHRNYTSESLIMIFETLSLLRHNAGTEEEEG